MVQCLVDAGANILDTNKDGLNPLMLAAFKGHVDIVKWLLDRGAHVNATSVDAKTALMFAVMGHTDVVGDLLAYGADVNASCKDGCTALRWGAAMGDADAVGALIAKGANIHTIAMDGMSALYVAIVHGHAEIVSDLLAAGAYCHHVVMHASFDATIQHIVDAFKKTHGQLLALQQGILQNYSHIQTDSGYTGLMAAVEANNNLLVMRLIALGHDVNAQDIYGRTALMLAFLHGSMPIIQYLIEHHADVYYVLHKADVVLQILRNAVKNNNKEVVLCIFEKNPSAIQKDNDLLACTDNVDMLRTLVQLGIRLAPNATLKPTSQKEVNVCKDLEGMDWSYEEVGLVAKENVEEIIQVASIRYY